MWCNRYERRCAEQGAEKIMEQGKGTATIPASENAIAAVEGVAVNGMCLIPAGGEEERAVVLDYLYRCVWKHKKSIREMLMEDSAAMSAGADRF